MQQIQIPIFVHPVYVVQQIFSIYLVADERHPPIVGPGEGRDGGVSVVDQLNAPSPFVLYPDENNSSGVTGGQLLIRFIPFHHRNLQSVESV